MNSKQQIWLKLGALTSGVMLLILVVMGASLYYSKGIMVNERKAQLRGVVESAISLAKYYKRQADHDRMTELEAKEKTKELVRSIRYGKNGYLFIYNADGTLEAHAFYRSLEGHNRLMARDAQGAFFVQKQLDAASKGGGFTTYHFRKPYNGEESYSKMGFAKAFEPWNWVFVTGVYVDDINAAFISRLKKWSVFLIPLFALLVLLTYYLAKTITRPIFQMEEAVQRTKEATKAKSDFLANMSHEIRTPLNGAMGMIALLLGTKMTSQQKEWSQIAYQSCEDLLDLINDILDLSKVESKQMNLEKAPFDLQATVKSVTDLFYSRAKKKELEIIVAFQSDLPRYVIGDAVRLRQILMNLVSNAVKFTESGHILISLEGHSHGDQYELKFEVKDTGVGIPASKHTYIFEKFSQAKEDSNRSYGGSGLGLALCRKIVTLMNGEIGVRSVEGEGSTFWFTITLGYDSSMPAVSSGAPHDRGEKILVDCKQKLTKKTLMSHLCGWSYHCADAAQGGGVLSMLQQDVALGQPYDFVISEVLPNMTETKDLITYINSIYNASPHTQNIFIVSPDSHYDYEALGLKESVAILTKPVFPQELYDVITKLIEHKRDKTIEAKVIRVYDDKASVAGDVVTEEVSDVKEKKILIAEDQKVNQMLMRTVLGQFGYETDVASNGIEAVRFAAEKQYDLIFMDGHMPEMDGLEATKQIREFEVRLKRHTPIIALTADAMKGDRDKCLAAGMDDYLHKPVKALQIKEMVEKHTAKVRSANEPEQPQ